MKGYGFLQRGGQNLRSSATDAGAAGFIETLYISYDGVLEPLGQSQIVSYMVGLSPSFRQTLLTFEKPRNLKKLDRVHELEAMLASHGIRWIRLQYHKWPPILSTLWDGIVGSLVGIRVCWSAPIQVVHARGYVPALMAHIIKRISGPKFLFDMRGFWADEKLEARRILQYLKSRETTKAATPLEKAKRFKEEGGWADEKVVGGQWSKQSTIYRITKRCEKLFFESADAIVSLTVAGVEAFPGLGYAVPAGTPIEVIPTCTDLERFKPSPKDQDLLSQLGLEGRVVFGCVGTISNWYLRGPMLDYLRYLVEHLERATVLMVTGEDHEQLRQDALGAGIPQEKLVLTQAEFAAMPAYVRLIDVGVFFIKASFGKKGSNATKLGEFLACGVPVIINDGVGDSGRIVKQHRVGVVLDDVTPGDFERSLPAVRGLFTDPHLAGRCRETAQQYFDLETGVRKYDQIYQGLTMNKVRAVDHVS